MKRTTVGPLVRPAQHSIDCERARAGHSHPETKEPDPYPVLARLTPDQINRVLLCRHPDHDVVRLFVSLVGQP